MTKPAILSWIVLFPWVGGLLLWPGDLKPEKLSSCEYAIGENTFPTFFLLLVFSSLLLLPSALVSVSSVGDLILSPAREKMLFLSLLKEIQRKVLSHVSTPSCEHSNSGGNKLIMARLMEEGKASEIIYYQVVILRSSCKFFIFSELPFLGTPSLIFNAIQNLRDHELPVLN